MDFSKLSKKETDRLFKLMSIPCYKMSDKEYNEYYNLQLKIGTDKEDIPERHSKPRTLKEKWKLDDLILKKIIMTKENTFASYYPKGNVIYINPVYLGSERTYDKIFDSRILKSLTNSDNILSTYVHELTHAYENVYYKKFHKKNDYILKIKKDNLTKILAFAKESKYNIGNEISLYAYDNQKDISELLAEAYTRKKLGDSKGLIEYILNLYGLGE